MSLYTKILIGVLVSCVIHLLILSYNVYKSVKCLTIKLGDLNEDYQKHEH